MENQELQRTVVIPVQQLHLVTLLLKYSLIMTFMEVSDRQAIVSQRSLGEETLVSQVSMRIPWGFFVLQGPERALQCVKGSLRYIILFEHPSVTLVSLLNVLTVLLLDQEASLVRVDVSVPTKKVGRYMRKIRFLFEEEINKNTWNVPMPDGSYVRMNVTTHMHSSSMSVFVTMKVPDACKALLCVGVGITDAKEGRIKLSVEHHTVFIQFE